MKRYFGTDWVRKLFGTRSDKTRKHKRSPLRVEYLEERLSPATRIWSGAAGANWSTPTNWVGNVAPVNGDDLVFPVSATRFAGTNDLATNTRFASITFSGSNYTLGGNQIVLGNNSPAVFNTGFIIANLGATNNFINFNMAMAGAAGSRPFVTVGTLGATLSINGQLVGGGGIDLSKDGVGTLILGGNNSTFVGAFTVTEGALRVRNAFALGTATAPTTVLNTFQRSGQLQIDNVAGAIAEPIRLNGNGPSNDGALLNFAGNNVVTGNIFLDSDSTIGANGVGTNITTLALQGVISDTGTGNSLTKEGGGTIILDPLGFRQGNIYRGRTFVNAGVLAIRHSLALGNTPPIEIPGNPGRFSNDTVVNSFPDRSGTLRLDFVPNASRIDPFVNATGFTVPFEHLVLNGPGVNGIHVIPKTLGFPGTTVLGALNNGSGNNTWSQDIALWTDDGAVSFDSLYWNWGTAAVGAEAGTTLTLAGRIGDPYLSGDIDPVTGTTNVDYSLAKTRPGRVILVQGNSFRGRTEVLEGYLNIRDSKALGTVGSDTNGTIVFPGGTLELETDTIVDSTTVASAQHLNTDIIIDQEQLTLLGTGAGGVGATGNGALRNLLGTNEVKGVVPLSTQLIRGNLTINTGAAFQDRGAWIGVEADRSPFNRFNLSQLTLSGQVVNADVYNHDTVRAGRLYEAGDEVPADLFKTGPGELVLSANNLYTGETYIRQGWVTARTNRALGGINPVFSDRDQPGTHVAAGAGLSLKSLAPNTTINLQENLWLSGDGITSRFAELNRKGALNNLGGNNTVAGDIYLISTSGFPQVGIGSGLDPLDRATTPTSELTLLGQVGESPTSFLVSRASYNNLPPLDVTVPPNPNPRDAGIAEDRFLIDVGSTAGSLKIDVSFVGTNTITVLYRGAAIGTLNFTPPVPNPLNIGSNLNPFRSTLTVPFAAVGNDTFVEIVMNAGAAADNTRRWQWDAFVTPTSRSAGMIKSGTKRLNLAGQGTFSGAVTVAQGVVRAQSDTALGVALTTNPTPANPPSAGSTTLLAGTALELQGTIPVATGGVTRGIDLRDNLVLNGQGLAEVQRVTVSQTQGTSGGVFQLGYNGRFTTGLAVNSSAAQVQNALNNQIFGAGSVSVTLAADAYTGSNIYTITFVRANLQGIDLQQFTAPAYLGATTTVGTVVQGGVQTLTNNSDDNMIRGAVTLGAGLPITVDTNPNSRLQLWGNVSGSGAITKNDTGKLVLGGNNSYSGNTRIEAGILNVQSPTALGLPGSSFNAGGTVIAPGAQIETQGDITIAGEALYVVGTGPTANNTVAPTWFAQGPNAVNGGQTGGTTAGTQNVSGRVTGVVTDPRNPNQIYVTTASGGAWRSKNSGLSWEPLIDRVLSNPDYPIDNQVLFASSIAVSPTSPNVLYVGLGNPTNSVEAYYGRGVLKSTDYGDTWELLNGPSGEFDRSVISKVVVDPTDPEIVYLAANAYGVNTTNTGFGIWRYRGTTEVWTNLTGGAVPAPAVPAGSTAPYFGAPERYSDLVVIDANPHLSDPIFPDFLPIVPPFYYFQPNLRVIAFTLGDPAGNPKNGIYAAFLSGPTDNIVGGMVATAVPTDNDAGWTIQNVVGGTETLAGLQNVSSWGEVHLTGVRPELQSTVATATAAASVQPEGRLDRRITLYATIAHPINSWRDLNQLDGKLRETRRITFLYNPALPTPAQWDNGGADNIAGIAQGGTAAASTQNLFGGTDTPITNPPNIRVKGNEMGTGWYAGALAASPLNRSVLFVGGLGQPYSVGPYLLSADIVGTDATASNTVFFNQTSTTNADSDIGKLAGAPHVNYHSATFDNLGRLLVGTDGGIWRFTPNSDVTNAAAGPNGGTTAGAWENLNGNFLQVTEFNGLDVHPFLPFVMAGGSLANGTSIYNGSSWTMTSGGHGGEVRIHNRNPNIIYAMSDNILRRSTNGGATWQNIHTVGYSTVFDLDLSNPNTPVYTYGVTLPMQTNEPMPFPYMLPQSSLGAAIQGEYALPIPRTYDSSGNFTFVLDPANPSRLIVVQRNPDPTDNDINVLQVTLNADQAGVPTFQTISKPEDFAGGHITSVGVANLEGEATTFAGAPVVDDTFDPTAQLNGANSYDPGTIYVLMSDKLMVTKNGGNRWEERSGDLPTSDTPLAPALSDYGEIVVDPRNRNRAYLTRHVFGGQQLFRTEDAGQTWVDITGNLPDLPVWTLEVNSRNGDLYVGNDNGVFRLPGASNVAGNFNNWVRFGGGLPSAQVKNLVFNATTNTLTAGTFGRGAFQLVLDDTAADFAASGGVIGSVRSASGSTVWTGNVVMPGPTEFRAAQDAQVNFVGQITEVAPATPIDPRFPTEGFYKVTKTGGGRVIFSGPNNFSGTIEVKQGVLTVRNPTALGKLAKNVVINGTPTLVGQTIVNAGAALEMQSNLQQERVEIAGDGIKFNGRFSGALRNVSNNNTFTGVLVLIAGTSPLTNTNPNPTIGVDSGSTLTIGTAAGVVGVGTVQGAAGVGFEKELTGTLVLNSTNTYTGITTINQGAISITNNRSLGGPTTGTPAQRLAAGTVVRPGGQLVVPGTLTVVDEDLTLSGTGIFDTGALRITGTANNSWAGPVHFDAIPATTTEPAAPQAGISVSAGTFTIPGAVNGDGGPRKVGDGRLVLPVNNTYTGLTTVAAGSLEIRTAGALGTTANGTQLTGGTLIVNPTPEADLTFVNEALSLFGGTLYNFRGNNTWTGPVTLQGGASVINVEANRTLTMSGAIGDTGAPNPAGSVTKRGDGRLILTGNKTYRGNLIIDRGAAQVDGGVGAQDLGNVSLNGGSLWGSGIVGSLAGSGVVNPGPNAVVANPVGRLRITGGVWNAATTFAVDVRGATTAGTDYDTLEVIGTGTAATSELNLGNARLVVSAQNVNSGDVLTIVRVTGGARLRGGFAGLAEGSTFLVGAIRFRINYTLTTVTLTVV